MANLESARFPALEARNLNGRIFSLPAEFEGTRNIVLMAFRRWHQDAVDSWVPYLNGLAGTYPELNAYELPMIGGVFSLARPFIDGGMAAAIPDPAVRARTLTVYTDVRRVMAALQIADTTTITVLLVDRQGFITWRTRGPYTPEGAQGLTEALAVAPA